MKIVGRDVDILALNVSYAEKQFQPVKQELDADRQDVIQLARRSAINEAAVVTEWAFKGVNLFIQPKRSRGQWRWIPTCPLVSLAISRDRINQLIGQGGLLSENLWQCKMVCGATIEVDLLEAASQQHLVQVTSRVYPILPGLTQRSRVSAGVGRAAPGLVQ